MSVKQKKLKIEDNARRELENYFESSGKSAGVMCEEIRQETDSKITPPTVYNWMKGSEIKSANLFSIIEKVRKDGYEFNI